MIATSVQLMLRHNFEQTMIENLKQEASKSEDKQQNEVSKLKLAVDKANEEIKAQRLQHDKEKTTLQDKFNQVHIYLTPPSFMETRDN